jgi:hypothetical protein
LRPNKAAKAGAGSPAFAPRDGGRLCLDGQRPLLLGYRHARVDVFCLGLDRCLRRGLQPRREVGHDSRTQASYVASTNVQSEASEQAARFCEFYHSKPAQLADRAGTISRFECTGRARGGDSFFVERMGL